MAMLPVADVEAEIVFVWRITLQTVTKNTCPRQAIVCPRVLLFNLIVLPTDLLELVDFGHHFCLEVLEVHLHLLHEMRHRNCEHAYGE